MDNRTQTYTYSVSPHLTNELIKSAERLGFALPVELLKLLQLDKTGTQRLPIQYVERLLRTLQTLSGDPAIGLRLGEAMAPSAFNLVGHLVMSCNTVGEALALVCQFQQLVIDCGQASFTTEGNEMVFRWEPRCELETAQRPLIDVLLSATRHFGIWVTGIEEAFSTVHFQYPEPRDTQPCQRIFGHPGCYQADYNGFHVPLSWRDRPIKSASDGLQPVIAQQARYQLQSIQTQNGYISRVTDVLLKLLPQGYSSIEKVAESLHVTPRTLQRHLNTQGTTYSDLLRRVRLDKANDCLIHTDMNLTDIALSLGYREQSSFSSAYKNWTGLSPLQARETATDANQVL